MSPSHNATVTAADPLTCLVCERSLPAGRPRRTCSDACRQALWRRRHQRAATNTGPIPGRVPSDKTVYQCPECDTRQLGVQRCEDCNLFMTRLGPGGHCPSCDEVLTIDELLDA